MILRGVASSFYGHLYATGICLCSFYHMTVKDTRRPSPAKMRKRVDS